MEEKSIFKEIPSGKNKFHSAILTSFSFNFHHFEYQVLKGLKLKWVSNIGILIDARMLDQSIGQTSAGLKQISKSYSVNGIPSNGAFHPKINLIIGDDEIVMVFGSGNISAGGHGKNHETFTSFYADSKDSVLMPLILEGWQYVEYLSKNLEGYSKERITSIIPNNCLLIVQKDIQKHIFHKIDQRTEIALVYNESTSVLNQLSSLIPMQSITTIRIVSPYYDEEGSFLLQLLDSFPNSKIQVYIPKDNGLPPTKLPSNRRIKFYCWEGTERGKKNINGKNKYPRKLHSKLYSFESAENNYFLIGSMNATIAGFGTMAMRGLNEEFGALYKTEKLNYFKELNISKSTEIKDITSFQRIGNLAPESIISKGLSHLIKVLSGDLLNTSIKIFTKEAVKISDLVIAFYDDSGNVIASKTDFVILDNQLLCNVSTDDLKKNPIYITILNSKSEEISNKQPINFLDRLYHTNPSKENRAIRALISSLEVGKINEFEILNYLNDLKPRDRSDSNPVFKVKDASGRDYTSDDDSYHMELTYAEAIEAYKNKDLANKILHTHNSVQLWNMISQIFVEKFEQANNEINDEEETASVDKGAKREFAEHDNRRELEYRGQADKIISDTSKLIHNYCHSIDRIVGDQTNTLNEISLCQFLLVSHVITVIYHFTEYNLPYEYDEKKKEFKGYSPQEWKRISKNNYSLITCHLLVAFAKLCTQNAIEDFEDNDLRNSKFNDYKVLVLNNLVLYRYLVSQNKIGEDLKQTLDLACLNIFDKLGLPDTNFANHIKQINAIGLQRDINFEMITNLKNALVNDLKNVTTKQKYFRIKGLGICYSIDRKSDRILFKSLLDSTEKRTIFLKEFDKL